MRHFDGIPPGGRTHLTANGALTIDEAAVSRSEASFGPGSPSVPLRGRPQVRPQQGPGGTDHILLGTDTVVYECGTKEAHFRLAQNEELRRASASEPAAGGRVVARDMLSREGTGAPRSVGGYDQMTPTVFNDAGAGPGHYNEGMDEAQRRAALDPAARQGAVDMVMAGKRVERSSQGLRVSRPAGGGETFTLGWGAEPVSTSARSLGAAPGGVDSVGSRASRPEQAVGGNSAAYLPTAPAQSSRGSSMASILQQSAAGPSSTAQHAGLRRVPGASAAGSTVAAMLHDEEGVVQHGYGAPPSPSRRQQPIGGRGLLVAGLYGLDEASPMVGARNASAHAQSNVVFG